MAFALGWHKLLPLVVFPCLFNGQAGGHTCSLRPLPSPPPKRNHHRSNSPKKIRLLDESTTTVIVESVIYTSLILNKAFVETLRIYC